MVSVPFPHCDDAHMNVGTGRLSSTYGVVRSGSLVGVAHTPHSDCRSVSPAPAIPRSVSPAPASVRIDSVALWSAPYARPITVVREVVQAAAPCQQEAPRRMASREGRAAGSSQVLSPHVRAASTPLPSMSSCPREVPLHHIRPSTVASHVNWTSDVRSLEAGLQSIGRLEEGLECIHTDLAKLTTDRQGLDIAVDGVDIGCARVDLEIKEFGSACEEVSLAEELRRSCAEHEICLEAGRRRQDRLAQLEAKLLHLAPLEARVPRAAEELAEADARQRAAREELVLARSPVAEGAVAIEREEIGRDGVELDRIHTEIANVNSKIGWHREELGRMNEELQSMSESINEVQALRSNEASVVAAHSAQKLHVERLEVEVARLRPVEEQLLNVSQELGRATEKGLRQQTELHQMKHNLSAVEAEWAQLREELSKAQEELDRRSNNHAEKHVEISLAEPGWRGAELDAGAFADELACGREELAQAEPDRTRLREAKGMRSCTTGSWQPPSTTEPDAPVVGRLTSASEEGVPESGGADRCMRFQESREFPQGVDAFSCVPTSWAGHYGGKIVSCHPLPHASTSEAEHAPWESQAGEEHGAGICLDDVDSVTPSQSASQTRSPQLSTSRDHKESSPDGHLWLPRRMDSGSEGSQPCGVVRGCSSTARLQHQPAHHSRLSRNGQPELSPAVVPTAKDSGWAESVDIVAQASDVSLGLRADSTLPGMVCVTNVDRSGWAARNGVLVGTAIVALNGLDTATMSMDSFMAELMRRPLRLTILAPGGPVAVAAVPPSSPETCGDAAPLSELRAMKALGRGRSRAYDDEDPRIATAVCAESIGHIDKIAQISDLAARVPPDHDHNRNSVASSDPMQSIVPPAAFVTVNRSSRDHLGVSASRAAWAPRREGFSPKNPFAAVRSNGPSTNPFA